MLVIFLYLLLAQYTSITAISNPDNAATTITSMPNTPNETTNNTLPTCISITQSDYYLAKKILENINTPPQNCHDYSITITIKKSNKKFTINHSNKINIKSILPNNHNEHTPYGYLEYKKTENQIQIILNTKNDKIILITKQVPTLNTPENTCSNIQAPQPDDKLNKAIHSIINIIQIILFQEPCQAIQTDTSYTSSIIQSFEQLKQHCSKILTTLITLYIIHFIYIQLLYSQYYFTSIIITFGQALIAVICLHTNILNHIIYIILQTTTTLIDIGTPYVNLCSDSSSAQKLSLLENIECFIIKLLFNGTDIISILTKIITLIISIIIALLFPAYGLLYTIVQVAAIILLLWNVFWILSFTIKMAVNITIQIISIILLLYISPIIIILWTIEKYTHSNFLNSYLQILINHIVSVPILLLISNVFILILYQYCDQLVIFQYATDIMNHSKTEEINSIPYISLTHFPLPIFDIFKVIQGFIATFLIMKIYPKITNFFLSRLTRTNMLNFNTTNPQFTKHLMNKANQASRAISSK